MTPVTTLVALLTFAAGTAPAGAEHVPFASDRTPSSGHAAKRENAAATLGTLQEPPTASELFARERTESGWERRAQTERETWNIRSGGLDGTLVVVRREADTVSALTLGPFHSARGFDRGQRWHQNDNGQTVLEAPHPTADERIVAQNVTRVHAPLDAWVVNATFAGGHVRRTFFNPRTYAIVRVEKMIAGRTVRTSYDDFRADARGRTRAWHEFGDDQRPEVTFDYRLVRDETGAPVVASELTIPHDRRALVEFPAGTQTVRLPARIANGRIYVRVTIDGRGLDFLLDSGAAAISLDASVARALGFAAYGHAIQTVAGRFAASRVVAPLVSIGPLAMRDVVMQTMPISLQEDRRTRVVGLLGFDFLAAVALRIDYANGTVDAARSGAEPAPDDAVPLEVRLGSQTPHARADVGDADGDDFMLDTGADFSLVLFARFLREHPGMPLLPQGDVRSGTGIGGSVAYRMLSPQRLTLGSWRLNEVPSVAPLSPNALGFDNEDGIIGSDVLRRFTVYLDYAQKRVFLAAPHPVSAWHGSAAVQRRR